jgi:hypothetical protein
MDEDDVKGHAGEPTRFASRDRRPIATGRMVCRMRTFVAIAFLVAGTLSAEIPSRIEGRVMFDSAPLPGCTVTLSKDSVATKTVADAQGRYSFPAVPAGRFWMTFELNGLATEERSVYVEDEVTAIPDVELRVSPITETITFTCSFKPCSDEDPASPFDEASCTDYEMNTTLIESMERGDRSATDLLRRRYAAAFTYGERHRIAGALLGRVPDDREYWSELAAYGADAIRFPYVEGEPAPEFVAWCAARALDPDQYHWMALRAFEGAAADRRGRGMVLQALESKDSALVQSALAAILEHRDESVLPAIEKALERFPEQAGWLAMWLGKLQSDAADRVALKFLPEGCVEEYREQQRQAACETMAGCNP